MLEANLLINLVSEINSHKPIHYRNNPSKNHKQSAVAILIRCSSALESQLNLSNFKGDTNKANFFIPSKTKLTSLFSNFLGSDNDTSKELFEILFLQRAFTEKDRHSGEICFPGGKCDNDETDYEAVIREVKEEIDYDLMNNDENSIYLGKYPKNFYVYNSRSGQLYVTIHLFFIMNYQNISKDSKFNTREVFTLQWFPLKSLLFPSNELLVYKKIKPKKNWMQSYPKLVQRLFNQATDSYEFSEYAGLDIGMKETLYGLTFFMVCYMLWVMDKVWVKDVKNKRNFNKLLRFSKHFRLVFQRKSIIGRVGGWLGELWYQKYRINEFKYQWKGENEWKIRFIFGICYLMVIYAFLSFFEIL